MALNDYEKKIVTDIAYQDLVYFKKETAEESNNVMDQINLMISEGKNFKGETLSDEKIEELTRVKNRLTEIGAEDWKVSYVQNHNEPERPLCPVFSPPSAKAAESTGCNLCLAGSG